MSPLAVVLAYLAGVIVLLRGPLAFAPQATVDRFRRWFFPSDARMRLVGLGLIGLIAAPLIVAVRMTPDAHPNIGLLEALGWLAVAGGAFVVVLPGPGRRLVKGVLVGAPAPVLRFMGVANIAFGIFLAWVAFAVL